MKLPEFCCEWYFVERETETETGISNPSTRQNLIKYVVLPMAKGYIAIWFARSGFHSWNLILLLLFYNWILDPCLRYVVC